MRPSFLDDVSAAEADRCTLTGRRRTNSRRRTGVISHEMSRHYRLEHPVDDPDEDEDDDFDEDDDGEDDEDADEEDVETWQVVGFATFR